MSFPHQMSPAAVAVDPITLPTPNPIAFQFGRQSVGVAGGEGPDADLLKELREAFKSEHLIASLSGSDPEILRVIAYYSDLSIHCKEYSLQEHHRYLEVASDRWWLHVRMLLARSALVGATWDIQVKDGLAYNLVARALDLLSSALKDDVGTLSFRESSQMDKMASQKGLDPVDEEALWEFIKKRRGSGTPAGEAGYVEEYVARFA
ncbi:hypothetical protein DXG01_002554 [Tephrocybe rancida]|nr:hypothetical protein DXG01_002554 [Tephrocybe rancida]